MWKRSREIISGRSTFAWSRRTARSAAWVREFSTASAWMVTCPTFDTSYWNASPFGERLAQLTGDRHGARAALEPRRPGLKGAPQETARVRRPDPHDQAQTVAPRSRVRRNADAGDSANRLSPRQGPGSRPGKISRSRLAALAGNVAPALRRMGTSSRSVEYLPRRPDAPLHSSERVARITAGPAASNTALVRRMTARLDRMLTRDFGRRFAAIRSPGSFADKAGWSAVVAQPQTDFAPASLATADFATAVPADRPLAHHMSDAAQTRLGIASTARSPSTAEAALRNWRRPIATPEPALALDDNSAEEAAAVSTPPISRGGPQPHVTPSRVKNPSDTSQGRLLGAQTAADSSQLVASAPEARTNSPLADTEQAAARRAPFALVAPHRALPRAIPEATDGGVHRMTGWPGNNQFEFAESLRLALIEDARRYGIDV